VFDDRLEHRLDVERRAADGAQNRTRRRLVIERPAQVARALAHLRFELLRAAPQLAEDQRETRQPYQPDPGKQSECLADPAMRLRRKTVERADDLEHAAHVA